MKVLIVEDDIDVATALKEAFTDEGHPVDIRDTVEGTAVHILADIYDIAVIDASVENGRGEEITNMVLANATDDCKASIIVIKDPETAFLDDNRFVKTILNKPFMSKDILDKVKSIVPGESGEGRKKKVNQKHEKYAGESMDYMGLEFGKSYVLYQENSIAVNRVTASFGYAETDILAVTTVLKKTVKERFRNCKIDVLSVKPGGFGEFTGIFPLGTFLEEIINFIEGHDRPVIVFDNLDTLILRNGLDAVLVLLDSIMKKDRKKPFSMVVSADAHNFTRKDMSILRERFSEYTPPKNTQQGEDLNGNN